MGESRDNPAAGDRSGRERMTHILVTGGAGALGRRLVPRLRESGHGVRILSRRPAAQNRWPGVKWIQGDLATGTGLAAVAGVDVVIHLATRPLWNPRAVDVRGTERLLDHAQRAAVTHLVYASIVGVDRIPTGYYQAKLAAEKLIAGSGVPSSILRATQFHTLIDL